MSLPPPEGARPPRFPVSVKGVLLQEDRVVLLKNERDEWELPGGRLEIEEEPSECVAREIAEELGLGVRVGPILDSWVYRIFPGATVLIVTYSCHPERFSDLTHSNEHRDVGLFRREQIASLNLPAGYKRSIETWLSHPAHSGR